MKASRRKYLVILLLGGVAIFCLAIWRDDTSVLRRESAKTQSEVRDLDHKLSVTTTRLDSKEMPSKPLPLSTVPATVPSQTAVAVEVSRDRDYRTEYGDIVYGSDSKVGIGNGITVSSPNGVMVSDQNQKLFVGDLQLENVNSVISGEAIVYEVGNPRVTGKNMKLMMKKPSQALPTPPAAQEPRQP